MPLENDLHNSNGASGPSFPCFKDCPSFLFVGPSTRSVWQHFHGAWCYHREEACQLSMFSIVGWRVTEDEATLLVCIP